MVRGSQEPGGLEDGEARQVVVWGCMDHFFKKLTVKEAEK